MAVPLVNGDPALFADYVLSAEGTEEVTASTCTLLRYAISAKKECCSSFSDQVSNVFLELMERLGPLRDSQIDPTELPPEECGFSAEDLKIEAVVVNVRLFSNPEELKGLNLSVKGVDPFLVSELFYQIFSPLGELATKAQVDDETTASAQVFTTVASALARANGRTLLLSILGAEGAGEELGATIRMKTADRWWKQLDTSCQPLLLSLGWPPSEETPGHHYLVEVQVEEDGDGGSLYTLVVFDDFLRKDPAFSPLYRTYQGLTREMVRDFFILSMRLLSTRQPASEAAKETVEFFMEDTWQSLCRDSCIGEESVDADLCVMQAIHAYLSYQFAKECEDLVRIAALAKGGVDAFGKLLFRRYLHDLRPDVFEALVDKLVERDVNKHTS